MINDLAGQRFGNITVLSRAADNPKRRGARWHTRCDCGAEQIRRGDVVRSSTMCRKCVGKSNGDRTRGLPRPCATKHGGVGTRLYEIWHSMKTRSSGTGNQYQRVKYKHVKLCDEWLSFEVFKEWAMASGYADDLSIDRIDNAKGYNPANCRWATAAEQAQNRAVCKFTAESVIEVRKRYADGETLTKLAREYETCASAVHKIVNDKRWKNIEQPNSVAQLGVE